MRTRQTFLRRHRRTFFALLFLAFFAVTVSYATPPSSPYIPGETLDPSCAPGDSNCSVQIIPSQTGNSGKYLTTDGGTLSWGTVAAGGGTWGSISGTLSSQTDLQNALNAKVASTRSITINGVVQDLTADRVFTTEVPLTFSTGLTRTTNTITNNLSTGASGGQDVIGGTASGESLTLVSTSDGSKGKILFGTSAYDEANNRLGIGTASPSSALDVTGTVTVSTLTGTGNRLLQAGATGDIGASDVDPQQVTDVFVISGAQNTLISGGVVSWVTGLTFDVSAADYYIQGDRYQSAASQVVLSAADVNFDRIDVIAVDINGNAVVIEGTPSATPSEPEIDSTQYLRLSFVYVPTAATTPQNVTSEDIYRENTEWTTSTNQPGTVDFNYATAPHAGTKSVRFSQWLSGANATFVRSSSTSLTGTTLVFYIKTSAGWGSNSRKLSLQWLTGSTAASNTITMKDGNFGFNESNTGWQKIAIPISQWTLSSTTADRFRITIGNNTTASFSLQFDDIELQGGVTNTAPQQNTFLTVQGDSGSYSAQTTKDTLRILGSNSISTSFSSNVVTIALAGDTASPGNSQYYGTNGGGTKGWFSLPPTSTITASNGLTKTSDDIALGGTLNSGTTVINAGTSSQLTIISSGNAIPFGVSNTGAANAIAGYANSGAGLAGISDSGAGVVASSTSGNAFYGTTTSGIGIKVTSTTGLPASFVANPSTTNTVVTTLELHRLSGFATATDGIGNSIDIYTVDAGGLDALSNKIVSKWTTAANASRTSQLSFTGVNNATTSTLFTLEGTGALKLNKYGVNSFTGTAAYNLAVDASGNVIEVAAGGGGTPTLQQVLTAGGTFSANQVADIGSRRLELSSSVYTSSYYDFHGAYTDFHLDDFSGDAQVGFYQQTSNTHDQNYLQLRSYHNGQEYSGGPSSTRETDLKIRADGLFITGTGMSSATTSDVLYYDSATGKVTYGAAPGGGGGTPTLQEVLTAGSTLTTAAGASAIASYINTDTDYSPYSESRLLSLQTNGTEIMSVHGTGAITIGKNVDSNWGGAGYGSFVAWHDASMGESANNELVLGASSNDAWDTYGYYDTYGSTSDWYTYQSAGNGTDKTEFTVKTAFTDMYLTLSYNNANLLGLNPTANSSAPAYTFDTSVDHLVGNIFNVNDAGTSVFNIDYAGALKFGSYGAGTFTGTAAYNLAVDASGNVIEVAAGGGGTPTLEDVLTAGSTLTNPQTITTSSFGGLTFSSAAASSIAATTGATSNAFPAIIGYTSTSAPGVKGQSSSGYGIWGTSTTGFAGNFEVRPSSTSTVVPVIALNRYTSGTAAAGLGESIKFQLGTATNSHESNTIVSQWTDASDVTPTSEFDITGVSSGVTNTLFTLAGSGALRLNSYGSAIFTGTAAYNLAVDASGNVIEVAAGGGGGTPTLQEVLTAGSTLTGPTNIATAGYEFKLTSGSDYLEFDGGDYFDSYLVNGSNHSEIYQQSNGGAQLYLDAASVSGEAYLELLGNGNITATTTGGNFILSEYGDGIKSGTPTYYLAVDTLGKVIEVASSPGTPTLQQVLTAGSTATIANTITSSGYNFKIQNLSGDSSYIKLNNSGTTHETFATINTSDFQISSADINYDVQTVIEAQGSTGAVYLYVSDSPNSQRQNLYVYRDHILMDGGGGVLALTLTDLANESSSQDALCITSGDVVQRNTGSQTCTVSSARFKHDIEALPMGALETIDQLIPSSFTYNGQTNVRIGLIAEEVNAIEPRLVFYEEDGVTPRGVRYEDLAALSIKGIQELNIKLNDIANFDNPADDTFVNNLRAWLANATNHITRIFTGEICLTDADGTSECLNKSELTELKQLINNSPAQATPDPQPSADEGSPESTDPVTDNDPVGEETNSDTTPGTDVPAEPAVPPSDEPENSPEPAAPEPAVVTETPPQSESAEPVTATPSQTDEPAAH